MNASINFEIRENKENAKGECPIYLRITYDRKPAWMSTGLKVENKDWNREKQNVRRSNPRYKKLNSELFRIESTAQDAILELKNEDKLNSKAVVGLIKGEDNANFFSFSKKYITNRMKNGSVRVAKNAKVIVNKIHSFHGSKNLNLKDIDHEFLEGLQLHLKNEYENKPNTIRKNYQRLNHILKTAKKHGYITENPLTEFKLPSYQKPKKEALNYSQIQSIKELNLKKETGIWHTRNYFLFSFYNAGIRFGDLCKLKKGNIRDGRLKYLMSKTTSNSEPKWKNIKLLPEALEILSQYDVENKSEHEYIFPIVDEAKNLEEPIIFDREKQSKNAIANKHLKKIAELAEIDQPLSTHIARHSFANYALKNGMNVYAISKALAHSDLKTTETYLNSFDEELLDEEMEGLFN